MESSASPTRPKIIAVDDHVENLVAIEAVLSSPDYDLLTFSSAVEALETISRSCSDIAVVLLDAQMPELDGFETAKRIRSMRGGSEIPVVFVTAIDRGDDSAQRAYESGAVDIVYKPYSPWVLQAKVRFFLTAFQSRARVVSQLKVITDALPNLISYVDRQQRYVMANKAYETWFGHRAEDILGRQMKDVLGERAYADVRENVERALRGESVDFEREIAYENGTKYVYASYRPDFDESGEVRGIFVAAFDSTEQHQAREDQRFLADLSGRLGRIPNTERIVEAATSSLAAHLGASRCWLSEIEGDRAIVHQDHADDLPSLKGSYDIAVFGADMVASWRRGGVVTVSDVRVDARTKDHADAHLGLGIRSFITSPILRNAALVGALNVSVTEARVWTDRELELCRAVAEMAWASFEHSRLLTALKESEHQFRTLADAIPQLAWIADQSGSIIWYNRRFYEFTGFAPEEMMGWKWDVAVHPECVPEITETWRRSIATGAPLDSTIRIRNRKGEYRWFQVSATPVRNVAGEIVRWFGADTDIQAQHDANEFLRNRGEQFQLITETIPQGIWRANPDGSADYFSRRFADVVGYTESELLGWGWSEIIHPDDHQRVLDEWQRCRDAGMGLSVEFRVRGRDGRYRWFLSLGNPFFDESGRITKYYGTWTDIDERKHSRDALERAAARLAFLSEASRVLGSSLDYQQTLASLSRVAVPGVADWCSVALVDEQGELKQISVAHADPAKVAMAEEMRRRFPFTRDNPTGPYSVIDTGRLQYFPVVPEELLRKSIQDPERLRMALELGLHSYICVPIPSQGRIVGAMTFATADSRRVFTEDDVRMAEEFAARAGLALANARLYREAQNINREKDEFLATLSHELRTPLNVIQGNAELLEMELATTVDADLASSIHAIYRNARLQTQIIDDLLDVSSIVTGKIKFAPEPVALEETIRQAVQSIKPAADAKGVRLLAETRVGSRSVVADPTRLNQILWNLLSNAVKFTPSGKSVRVRAFDDGSFYVLEVQDEGIGIDPEFLPYVFDRFRQEDSSSTRKFGGLGLGLSIVRSLAELHGGTVQARSEGRDQGSTFVVRLPIARAHDAIQTERSVPQRPSPQPSATATLRGLRILLVEDSADNRALVTRMLKKVGAEVLEADSARQARERLATWQPDVIVSDIGMPDESGLAFIRGLRGGGIPSAQGIPAIALTAYVRQEEIDQTIEAGFQAHVAKPVVAGALIEAVSSLVKNTRH